MEARFFLPKMPNGLMNMSVTREDGARLSFAADDSCGVASRFYIRTYLELINPDGTDGYSDYAITPELYLKSLADFLGYDIVKKEERDDSNT